MTAQDPVDALARAFVSALCGGSPDCENMADHQNDAHAILAALPPGWRLVGPDAVVVTVEDVARRLFAEPANYRVTSTWDECPEEAKGVWRGKARRLLGQEGE